MIKLNMTTEIKDTNVIDIDFEKSKLQSDIEVFKTSGKIPDTLTSRKFLIKYKNIYECVKDWSYTLNMSDDIVRTNLIDTYIEYAKEIEIVNANDVIKQLEKETKIFFKTMGCRTYKFMTTTIKVDPIYKSHIFSLGRELEFIVPKIRYGFELN